MSFRYSHNHIEFNGCNCLTDDTFASIISMYAKTIQHIVISNCPLLTTIPFTNNNINCIHLTNNQALRSLPKCLNLKNLSIENCPLIQNIPNYYNLKSLLIENLPYLKSINNLKNLESLNILFCSKLIKLPKLPNLTHLHLRMWKSIKKIPYYPLLRSLELIILILKSYLIYKIYKYKVVHYSQNFH